MSPSRAWLVAAGTCLAAFVALAAAVTHAPEVGVLDRAVQHAVLTLRAPGLTLLMQALTDAGTLPAVVGVALAGVLLLALRTRDWRAPVVLALTVGLSALTTALVKIAIARPRPGPDDRIGPAALDFAYPSGHTGDGSVAWCGIALLVGLTLESRAARRVGVALAMVLSAGIGLSRVYLGYHWPSDVVGAWCLAAASTCAAAYVTLTLRPVAREAGPVAERC